MKKEVEGQGEKKKGGRNCSSYTGSHYNHWMKRDLRSLGHRCHGTQGRKIHNPMKDAANRTRKP
jgi:hypothetical protein